MHVIVVQHCEGDVSRLTASPEGAHVARGGAARQLAAICSTLVALCSYFQYHRVYDLVQVNPTQFGYSEPERAYCTTLRDRI